MSFLNAYSRANELNWEFDKMDEDYEDKEDYRSDGIVALHFYQFFQPWSEHNLRFNPIWKEYYEECNCLLFIIDGSDTSKISELEMVLSNYSCKRNNR